jgi:ATP-dependent Zn protease
MPEYDPVAKISIIPRGQAGGLTFFAPSEERLESGLYSRSYLENQMAVALGGRCKLHETFIYISIHLLLLYCKVMTCVLNMSPHVLQGC